LENLYSIGCLLKDHPESFHPTEEELYDFVCYGKDAHPDIAEHLLSCASCREEEKILREMIAEQVTVPDPLAVLPESLRSRLRRIGPPLHQKIAGRLLSKLDGLIRPPFRVPVLALGSAVAVLIIAVGGVTTWRSLEHRLPQLKPPGEAESMVPHEPPAVATGIPAVHGSGAPPPPLTGESELVHREAAEQGDAVAQYKLGNIYRDGVKVPKDDRKAVRWYRKAAEQGLAQAQHALATMYMHGQGVASDYKEAAKWYRKAAEQSLAAAQYHLGRMYENGWGVLKDHREAVKWYRRAAEQGDKEAKQALARILETD
jgi:hypothetical protein